MSLKNNHPTPISVVHVVEVPSSWVAEVLAEAEEVSAEEVSEAAASEAVVPEVGFKLRPVSS